MADKEAPYIEDIEDDEDEASHDPKTHLELNKTYSGKILTLKKAYCKTEFESTREMSVDSHLMTHNGFVFGAASYAAALAVNEANVVVAEANVTFLSAVPVGKKVIFEASSSHHTTRSRDIKVIGKQGDIKVFEGAFKMVIMEKHPLRLKLTD